MTFQPGQPVLLKGKPVTIVHQCADKSAKGEDRYVVSTVNAKGRRTTVVALASNLKA